MFRIIKQIIINYLYFMVGKKKKKKNQLKVN